MAYRIIFWYLCSQKLWPKYSLTTEQCWAVALHKLRVRTWVHNAYTQQNSGVENILEHKFGGSFSPASKPSFCTYILILQNIKFQYFKIYKIYAVSHMSWTNIGNICQSWSTFAKPRLTVSNLLTDFTIVPNFLRLLSVCLYLIFPQRFRYTL